MALRTVHKDCDGCEDRPHVQLPTCEDRSACRAELRLTALALEDFAGLELVHREAAALRAERLSIVLPEADRPKLSVGLLIRQAQHLRQTEGPGLGGKKEVLCHLSRI